MFFFSFLYERNKNKTEYLLKFIKKYYKKP